MRELNGTPVWWQRGMAQLLGQGQVAFDYSRGWNRAIGEIFAEDYAFVHTGFQFSIPWLAPPDDALRNALLAELGGQMAPLPETPAAGPLVINRSGTVAARRSTTIPFGLLGPGRRVTYTVTVGAPSGVRPAPGLRSCAAAGALPCGQLTRNVRTRTLDVPNLGPAECTARIVSTASVRLSFSARLRLAVEA